jgi:hypothetical protein
MMIMYSESELNENLGWQSKTMKTLAGTRTKYFQNMSPILLLSSNMLMMLYPSAWTSVLLTPNIPDAEM